MKVVEKQRDNRLLAKRVRNSRHLPGPRIGNSRLMLQVRYCSAVLIIDERMQIYYWPAAVAEEPIP
jgi:hypothetical protein